MSHLPGWDFIRNLLIPLVFAASTQSLVISGVPATLDENQEAEITVNLTCTGCSTDSHIRGVFFPSGTSYFGYTQNEKGDWVNLTADCYLYFLKFCYH